LANAAAKSNCSNISWVLWVLGRGGTGRYGGAVGGVALNRPQNRHRRAVRGGVLVLARKELAAGRIARSPTV
jgi:hypothetical protein